MSKEDSFKDRLIYKIDNSISHGTGNIILWLAIILAIMVLTMALLVWFSDTSPENSLSDQIWRFFEHGLIPHFPDELVNQCHEMKILL
jgi:hypothetical protein